MSYGRRGPKAPHTFTAEQLAQLSRTATGAHEVLVKVSGGGRDTAAVMAHLSYIGRNGDLALECEDGERHGGKRAAQTLIEDWDLDLYTHRIGRRLTKEEKRHTPKLAHNLVLSMPKATDSAKMLAAVRAFAREEFAGRHRYALVLHTDTPHPHVHLVVKAESEEGPRLYIRKATLRRWREEFARHLRNEGVAANATPRAVRGHRRNIIPDGLYRVRQRAVPSREPGERATRARSAVNSARDAERDSRLPDAARHAVIEEWKRSLGVLLLHRQMALATQVGRFIVAMSGEHSKSADALDAPAHEPPARTR
jgi:type IV secretory pathway VirD2 relaxase